MLRQETVARLRKVSEAHVVGGLAFHFQSVRSRALFLGAPTIAEVEGEPYRQLRVAGQPRIEPDAVSP